MRVANIGWTNLPLLALCLVLLVQAWHLPFTKDPGPHGDIMVSMVLSVRALTMRQSKWPTIFGCTFGLIALALNAGFVPGHKLAALLLFAVSGLLTIFWDQLVPKPVES